jgi:hypothetical protein
LRGGAPQTPGRASILSPMEASPSSDVPGEIASQALLAPPASLLVPPMVGAEPLVLASAIGMLRVTVMAVPTVRRCAGLSGMRRGHYQQDHKRECQGSHTYLANLSYHLI